MFNFLKYCQTFSKVSIPFIFSPAMYGSSSYSIFTSALDDVSSLKFILFSMYWCYIVIFFFFGLYRAAPMAYEGSQARGSNQSCSPLTYTTATATPDLSCICDLYHSSQQYRIPNPLSEARDWTLNVMVPSWVCFCCSTHCNFFY